MNTTMKKYLSKHISEDIDIYINKKVSKQLWKAGTGGLGENVTVFWGCPGDILDLILA